jgi:hypothetical protein
MTFPFISRYHKGDPRRKRQEAAYKAGLERFIATRKADKQEKPFTVRANEGQQNALNAYNQAI